MRDKSNRDPDLLITSTSDMKIKTSNSLETEKRPATIICSIDRFSIYKRALSIGGWIFCVESPVIKMGLKFPSGRTYALSNPGITRGDVAAIHGQAAMTSGFDFQVIVEEPHEDFFKAMLVVTTASGETCMVSVLAPPPAADSTHWVTTDFQTRLGGISAGRLLEVGSRARSGIVRSSLTPKNWSYTGLDVMVGDNVDIVGDAHQLSKLFQNEKRFDAVTAFSVLEHLLMPWKFAVELNKVLNVGAIGLFTTHQAWPIHDAPWDFWRFSDKAWSALFNKATGFEIISTALGEPASTVAWNCHPVTDFQDQPSYLSSVVLFRKISETKLDWPVELDDILDNQYPPGQLPMVQI
jgi:hypothetical protein